MPRVLVVDDDPMVTEVLLTYLGCAGFDTDHASDGSMGLSRAYAAPPDLVVLDLMLPGLDGLEVCRQLRSWKERLPIVMLTARGEEEDRVVGLQLGADDYITKPFSPRELVLRVQSVLRRTAPAALAADTAVLVDGDLRLDCAAHQTFRGEDEVSLTTREFDLLAFLVARPGRAFDRAELMRLVWGWEYGDQSTVTVHVRRLREKVEEDPAAPCRLVTVWGVGYRWDRIETVAHGA
ncbi:MAG: response regulator transcription factor [Candidatus Nanopelagicales bacterium]